jgi:hypothetical protein
MQDVFDDLRGRGIVAGAATRTAQWADWAAKRGYTERLERTRFFPTLRQALAAYVAEVAGTAAPSGAAKGPRSA